MVTSKSGPLPVDAYRDVTIMIILPYMPRATVLLLCLLMAVPDVALLSVRKVPDFFTTYLSKLISLVTTRWAADSTPLVFSTTYPVGAKVPWPLVLSEISPSFVSRPRDS